tara:strand:- start:970 stop:1176 length:207 start_codon:yes stop_codon:yes gene_type:complete
MCGAGLNSREEDKIKDQQSAQRKKDAGNVGVLQKGIRRILDPNVMPDYVNPNAKKQHQDRIKNKSSYK